MRNSTIERNTSETNIKMEVFIEGKGETNFNSGIGFFDHMIKSFVKHSHINLNAFILGDLNVDYHHTVEDSGIVLGEVILKALGDKKGIQRYYSFVCPMDDALVECAIDLSGRNYYLSDYHFLEREVGEFPTELFDVFFSAISSSLKANIHFIVLRGNNTHHIIEAAFKGFGKCLKEAMKIENDDILSTKGVLL
jgi:imidazoleglycerol-phosphate dehydratase